MVVDLRKDSSTHGTWIAQELSAANRKKMYIPKGCAHGFQTLTDDCEVLYMMSEFYAPEYYSGVRWDDPLLKIVWPEATRRIISERDRHWPLLQSL